MDGNKDKDKLVRFASAFGCEPAVAFVFVDKVGVNIDVYLVKLADFEKLCTENINRACFCLRNANELTINNAPKWQDTIKQTSGVRHMRLSTEMSLYTDMARHGEYGTISVLV